MKTIKLCISLIILMSINKILYSYNIEVIKPNPCPDFFSASNYPDLIYQVKFNAKVFHQGDSSTILYKIFVEQHGQSMQMDQERIGLANEETNTSINLHNFPVFFNELLVVKIEVKSYNGNGVVSTARGYLVVYISGGNHEIHALTNGTSQLTNTGFCTFYNNSDCSLSSTNYYIQQHKITFPLNGNFTDSIPEIEPFSCFGFNGACPQNQNYWGAKVSQSSTQATFITFVYRVWNILGQDKGWWPGAPHEATVAFRYIKRPVIYNLVQVPGCIQFNNSAYVFCNLSQGNGSLKYDWIDSMRPPGVQFIPQGNRVLITRGFLNSPASSNSAPPHEAFCRVENEFSQTEWKKIRICYTNYTHACPTLRIPIAGNFIDENSLLNQSISNPAVDVEENYLIMHPLLEDKENIEFKLYEPGTDSTFLDLFELYKVSVNKSEMVAVTNNGVVVNYTNPDFNKIKAIRNFNEDISEKLWESDNNVAEMKKDDKLSVSFVPDGSSYVIMLIREPVAKDQIAGTINTMSGRSYLLFSRQNNNIVCIKLEDSDAHNFEINFVQDLSIDHIAVVKNLGTGQVDKLEIKSANHNRTGNVQKHLVKQDKKYATLFKGEEIHYVFENKINPQTKGVYFLRTSGRYKKNELEDSPLLKETSALGYKLSDNFPNPFNPSTIINFQIPVDGFVRLTIYDVTGKYMLTLVKEFRKAGQYEEVFDGRDLPSGIYFYKLQTNGFSQTKRMILIK